MKWLLRFEDKEQLQVVGRTSSLGIELGLAVCLGFFGGRWLDGYLGTDPLFLWIGLALGLAAGANSLYQLTRKTRAELDSD